MPGMSFVLLATVAAAANGMVRAEVIAEGAKTAEVRILPQQN